MQNKKDGMINMTKKENMDQIDNVNVQKSFTSLRALAQYIGVNKRPGICATVQLIEPGSDPSHKQNTRP